ncbi:MAG: ShlB/FhaC/HecB family hemolysin secretion/activation protein [Nitrospina sp.]|nr:ShlB/FhaC/HecB family hemolysin secretion/activation protein [Nitrospina sp.]
MENSRALIGPNQLRVLILFLAGMCNWPLQVSEVYAQISPEGRDRTYKQAAPHRFDRRFGKRPSPKSSIVPIKPKSMVPVSPKDLKGVNFIFKRLFIQGTTIYGKRTLKPFYSKYLNKKTSLKDIYEIAQTITNKYRNDGYILSKAIVPPQKINNGVVYLKIVEGYIDKINLQGPIRGPRKLINQYRKKILKSRPLRALDLERYLLLIDDLPGVTAKSVLTPSEDKPNATTMTLILSDKAFEGHVGTDNRGSKFNGPYEFSGDLTANSLLGDHSRTGLQGVITSQTEELLFLNAFYDLPIGQEGTRLFFSGSASDSEPGSSLKQFNINGDSRSVTLRLTHPFLRSRGKNLTGHLGFGGRNSTTKILGSVDSEDRLRVINMGVSYDYADEYKGVNLIRFNLSQGLNIFDATKSGSPNLSRSLGRSDFTKLAGSAMRVQNLAPSWNLLVASSWQYSFDKLLASEEFGVGGSQYGRAYDSSEITGDHGIAFKVELQKAFRPAWDYLSDFQLYSFLDYGSVWNKVQTSTGAKRQDLTSIGLGMRFNVTDSISGYLEMNKPVSDNVAAEGNKDSRLFFSLSNRF